MDKYAKVGLAGMLVSFLGTLPLGTLNITAFDIAASKGLVAAVWFALAVVLVELVMVRLTLFGNHFLQIGEKLTKYVLPLGALLLFYLAISSFLASMQTQQLLSETNFFPRVGSAFVLGLLLSSLNPLQFPFWVTCNKVLSSKGMLENTTKSYNCYLLGIGLGTLVGLGVFIAAGKFIFTNYTDYSRITNLLMGTLYLGFSVYLAYLIIKKHLKPKIQ
ncbi:LysE family translocator [Flagellimonas myxillae]|uniref:LysE family translocator n=1 Tax=Flagellimonas myxillae TaxID=2942214 RepID=UPI00201F63F6|nr:LysE family transporter [Muricauda myxillae]MCL6268247.1 LysE family transporter [Muricauda myxillae]